MVIDMSNIKINKLWLWVLVALLASFILVISFVRIYAPEKIGEDALTSEFIVHLDNRISTLMEAYEIPGVSIALIKGGNTIWTKAYGYANLKNDRVMTTDTQFRVQSISKPITAWGVMKLAERGLIDLDKPVVSYITNWEFPPSSYQTENITIRQLLSHTSGMPLGDVLTIYSPRGKMPSLEDNLTEEAVLLNEPGTKFCYSNTGYNLLELLIEEVTGRDFAEYMENEILYPLGMQTASFNWRPDLTVPVGYGLEGQAVPPYVCPAKASGGLFASVGDIAAFARGGMNHQQQQILGAESIKELYTPISTELGFYSLVFDGYGLGYYVEYLPGNHMAVSHGGQGTGIMTHLHYVPDTGDGIVILTNSQRSWPFIAYILSDWAQWSGYNSVGMSAIIAGKYVLCSFIGLLWLFILIQIMQLTGVFARKTRRFAPLAKQSRMLRGLLFVCFAFLTGGLIWWKCQDYSFISSVFPIMSGWLGLSLSALAVILLLLALFPIYQGDGSHDISRSDVIQ